MADHDEKGASTGTGLSRRTLLAGGAALGAMSVLPRKTFGAAPEMTPVKLEASKGVAQLLDPGEPKTNIWGYGGKVPGPMIRLPQGAEVRADLINGIGEPTTIHWHGIRIDNRMDGVAHLTQPMVAPGKSFAYRFKVPDAGTYWYHPHAHMPMQQGRGLYGFLIVDEPAPPAVDQDVAWMIDDWLLKDDGAIHEASIGSVHDMIHGGRLGNVLTVNGAPLGRCETRAGERLRLRLCSSCNSRVLQLRFEDVAVQLLAVDGQPVAPEPLPDGKVTIPPAGRADVIVDITGAPGSKAAITEVSGERLEIGHFYLKTGERARDQTLKTPVALARNPVTLPKLDSDPFKFDLIMAGGAMGSMAGATYEGKYMPIRDLVVKHNMAWSFNGFADRHDKPAFSVERGRTAVIRMVNDTAWRHAMHIHGHHFQVFSRDKGELKPWLHDTVLMQPNEEMTIAFTADNPGKWMIHCHMLEHQMSGMSTFFEVAA